jgi:adenylate cyclase
MLASNVGFKNQVSGPELKQRLVAILAADVAGYSRLMSLDERATVAALDVARTVFRRNIDSSDGRVIDMAGDSVLAVFKTATGAVNAALAIQNTLNDSAKAAPQDRSMLFRIGIHLGDVVEKDDGTVYGDGVNIASRLEGLADLGGIAVSGMVHEAVRSRVTTGFEDLGEQHVKNISHAVRVYRVLGEGKPAASARGAHPNGAESKPSIAVLPFNVLSDDQALRFLADGLAEDVIALLARVAGFRLISRASSFSFREQETNATAIAKQLGVRYIVEGSVRPVGDRVRVSTHLTEGATRAVLWSGRLESPRETAEDLQDAIARGIISELEPELTRAEIVVIRRQRPENVDAWGCYRQAIGAIALKGWNEGSLSEARALLRRAVEIDPSFGLAYAQFAVLTAIGKNTGVIPPVPRLDDDALDAAERAIALDESGSEVLGYAGCAMVDLGHYARGLEIIQRAIDIDPSNAQAHVALGGALAQSDQLALGIDRMRFGMQISPRDRRLGFWGWVLGLFLSAADRPEDALQEARKAIRHDSKLYLAHILEAAMLATLSRTDEARLALSRARRLRPSLTLDEIRLTEIRLTHGYRSERVLRPLWESE